MKYLKTYFTKKKSDCFDPKCKYGSRDFRGNFAIYSIKNILNRN